MIPFDHPHVQGLVPPTGGRKTPRVLLWLWPRPVAVTHRLEMPPGPQHGRSVVGKAAREEARRLLRDAKRARVNFGRLARRKLREVIRGERCLSYGLWHGAVTYLEATIRERQAAEKGPQYRITLGGNGLQVRRPGR